MTLAIAQRAQDLGLPLMAVDLYRQARDVPGADREELTLLLATALLDAGRPQDVEQALAELPEPHNTAWHLRAGLAAVQLKKMDVARAELAAIKEDEVPVADYPWYWFFQGELVDLATVKDISRANDFYRRAENNATTALAKARFQLAAERVRLQSGTSDLKTLRENYERHKGTPIGYENAVYYAMAADAQGNKTQAVTFLQGVLRPVQRQEAEWWDKLRLVLGLIGEKTLNGAGRTALNQLVESGNNPERQRQALQLLAGESATGAERKQFQDLLKKWIDAKPDHPIKESLLFYRAQLALAEKEFVHAETDANALLSQFPRSPLRVHAFGVLTQSAWEQRRFRLAAGFADKARAELSTAGTVGGVSAARLARARADLGVLVAEARFRAGLLAAGDQNDFRLAADAYAAVLRDRPAELERAKLGALMFQRVLAEIKSGSGQGSKVLDEMARDPALDVENRWQAEWSLARALQLQGPAGVKEAFTRIDNLLREPLEGAAALKPELRARMTWLHARLAFENGEAEQAIKLVEAALALPPEVGTELKTEIASSLTLLKARAEFALGREPVALETLKRLRAEYLKTEAAISSYMIESEYYAAQDKIEEARKRLISLTDNQDYKDSEYVPLALYRLALLSERLGREENLREANKRIEELMTLVNSRAANGEADLIFAARLKQGDIFRKLNDFPSAQRAYEYLVNNYSRRPDVVLAQLKLAECHNAQSSLTDPLHADTAKQLFEQLLDRFDAPRDVRIEAGYNLGALLARRGKTDQAVVVWWRDVIDQFLLKEDKALADAKSPYWLARTLRELGDLQEKLGRVDEAKATYRLLLQKRLPYGEAVARARLEQFGVLVGKPVQ